MSRYIPGPNIDAIRELELQVGRALVIKHTNGGVFDPKITYPGGATGYWVMDDGETIPATSGVAISYTPATAGSHMVGLLGVDLDTITVIDCNTDLVTAISPLLSLTAMTRLVASTNVGLVADISDLPASLTYVSFANSVVITGALSDLPASVETIAFSNCALITGPLSDMPASLTIVYVYGCPLLIGDSIGHMTGIGICQIQNCQFDQAEVDAVLADMYANRASFTDLTPELNIGGDNAQPSGVYQDDATPSTGKEYIYKLVNDPDTEGFKTWVITYTGSP